MRKIENECVGCPPHMGCLGSTCPYKNVERIICDDCGYECDEDCYIIDEKDYCEECALNYIQSVFDDLTLCEKAEALNIYIRMVD